MAADRESQNPSDEDLYQEVPPSLFNSEFRKIYDTLWQAEQRFGLLSRQDHGVYPWAANRIRVYYELARGLGLYDEQAAQPSPQPTEEKVPSLAPVDVYIQTGAIGPATRNRTRRFGCVYTTDLVERLIDANAKILLVHDDPDQLDLHSNLMAITTSQLRLSLKNSGATAPKASELALTDEARSFWAGVDQFFIDQLGTSVADPDRVQTQIVSHKRAFATNRRVLETLAPNAMVCMAHYFRAAQIDAAQSLGIHTVDYQHGINSRYHVGYGVPHLKSPYKKLPYFPDEFWSWGAIWTGQDWFPHNSTSVRLTGHYNQPVPETKPGKTSEKTILMATSWAMRSQFTALASVLAKDLPDWVIRLKLHPRETLADYQSLQDRHDNIELVSGDADILTVASEIPFVISICSSALFDVLLVGCRIAVLKAPSVEYAEDFIRTFDVPVLEADGRNIADVIEAMKSQSIPLEEVFHKPHPIEKDLQLQSLMTRSPARDLTRLSNTKPADAKGKVLRKLSIWALAKKDQDFDVILPEKAARVRRWLAPHYRNYFAGDWEKRFTRRLAEITELRDRSSALKQLLAAGASPDRHKTALLRLIEDAFSKDETDRLRGLLRLLLGEQSDASEQLQAKVLERALYIGGGHPFWESQRSDRAWQTAVRHLKRLGATTEYLAHIYEEIAERAQAEYADTRVSEPDSQRLKKELIERLEENRPFTMMRLGDGEVYGFTPDYVPHDALRSDQRLREGIWWGTEISPELRTRLQTDFQKSLNRVDFLAVPSPFRLIRDFVDKTETTRLPIGSWIPTRRAHYVLLTEMRSLMRDNRLDWSTKSLIDDRSHQELFDRAQIEEFHQPTREQILVSCFSKAQVNEALGLEFFTDEIRLPPHTKVKDYVLDDEFATLATPHLLDSLLSQIDQKASGNPIFYVAGGFVGKIMIGQIARAAATALDIGASADYWMGIKTRGRNDFTRFL